MSTEQWQILSDWHNAWLTAPFTERDALRIEFNAAHPELMPAAEALTAPGEPFEDGFLATPAIALAAEALAKDDALLVEGTSIGPYQIAGLLARGGMGDVYRAHDPRLDRDVALKTVTPTAAIDGRAIERFLQEARITASLDHPNIVRVFDVGMTDGRPYLVTELLDGRTLREVIVGGPIAAGEVRSIAVALASGLSAAHARGLIHRDLKPENVLVTRAGTVKILDFGIAKLAQDPALPGSVATLTGVILGTAGYLAPEQITGGAVDARADLFALGSILFELLTGRRAFARDHTIDTLHAILHDDPPDLLPAPEPLTPIVRRLLEKSPDARFQSATDLRWLLERPDTVNLGLRPSPASRAHGRWRMGTRATIFVAVVIALVSGAVGGGRLFRWTSSPPVSPRPVQFTWSLPAGLELGSAPVVSPDGSRFAFVGRRGENSSLFVRPLDVLEPTEVAGTQGASQPFWSPHGDAIAFFARGKLMKVLLAGGVPVMLADALDSRGGAWSPTGTIVFAPDLIFSGLMRVSADGGPVSPATRLDLDSGENSHRWPAFLPDGLHFLYHVRTTNDDRRGIYIGTLDGSPAMGALLVKSESESAFVATEGRDRGVLLSAADGQLQVRPFDARTRTLMGDPRTLRVSAGAMTPYHSGMFSASTTLLASVGTSMPYGDRWATVSRDGSKLTLSTYRQQLWPRVSPDGRRIARQLIDPERGNPDLWIEDLVDGSLIRVTSAPGVDLLPVWSPDGRRLAYGSGSRTERRLSIAAADGTGVIEEFPCPATYCEPTDWSRDGHDLIVNTRTSMSARPADVWRVSAQADHASRAILSSEFAEYDARLSPDGEWLAYVSEESGRPEVSVRAMSGNPRRVVASSTGGSQPVWRRDGRELLYVDLDGRLQARAVRHGASADLELGPPEPLPVPTIGSGHWGTQYDLSPDGQRIYFIDRTPQPGPVVINLLQSWQELLEVK